MIENTQISLWCAVCPSNIWGNWTRGGTKDDVAGLKWSQWKGDDQAAILARLMYAKITQEPHLNSVATGEWWTQIWNFGSSVPQYLLRREEQCKILPVVWCWASFQKWWNYERRKHVGEFSYITFSSFQFWIFLKQKLLCSENQNINYCGSSELWA